MPRPTLGRLYIGQTFTHQNLRVDIYLLVQRTLFDSQNIQEQRKVNILPQGFKEEDEGDE